MKKIFVSWGVLLLLFALLTACGASPSADSAPVGETSAPESAEDTAADPLGPDADPASFTVEQCEQLERTSDLTLCLSWETGAIEPYLDQWLVVSGLVPWDSNDAYRSVDSQYGTVYYFKDQENYDRLVQECLIGNYASATVLGYFQEAGTDTYEMRSCIYLGGSTDDGTGSAPGGGAVLTASPYAPPRYEGGGVPAYMMDQLEDPRTFTEEDLQKYAAHIEPSDLYALDGQEDEFVNNRWVVMENLRASLNYTYSSASFHDAYQNQYTFQEGEDIYLLTRGGRSGQVIGYVTYDRGFYHIDHCIVLGINSPTTSGTLETYEFTAGEFSEIEIDDSVVYKYADKILRITGVQVKGIGLRDGEFISNISNKSVFLLDPRELETLRVGDIVTVECQLGIAMELGYAFCDAVIVD